MILYLDVSTISLLSGVNITSLNRWLVPHSGLLLRWEDLRKTRLEDRSSAIRPLLILEMPLPPLWRALRMCWTQVLKDRSSGMLQRKPMRWQRQKLNFNWPRCWNKSWQKLQMLMKCSKFSQITTNFLWDPKLRAPLLSIRASCWIRFTKTLTFWKQSFLIRTRLTKRWFLPVTFLTFQTRSSGWTKLSRNLSFTRTESAKSLEMTGKHSKKAVN